MRTIRAVVKIPAKRSFAAVLNQALARAATISRTASAFDPRGKNLAVGGLLPTPGYALICVKNGCASPGENPQRKVPQPKHAEGHENWIPTVSGKAWFEYLRLYGPLEPSFDKTWRTDESSW